MQNKISFSAQCIRLVGLSLITFLIFVLPAWPASVTQHTEGPCSPAVADVKGNVNIVCKGIDPAVLNEMIKLLNEILQKTKNIEQIRLEFDKARNELRAIQNRTQTLEREIREISGEVSFEIKGNWAVPLTPGESRPVGENKDQAFISLISDVADRFPPIVMTLLDVSRKNLDATTALVRLRAGTPSGRWPLGQDIGVLVNYRKFEVALPMISRRESTNGEVTAVRTMLAIYVNGRPVFRRDETVPIKVVLPETGWRIIDIEYQKPIVQLQATP